MRAFCVRASNGRIDIHYLKLDTTVLKTLVSQPTFGSPKLFLYQRYLYVLTMSIVCGAKLSLFPYLQGYSFHALQTLVVLTTTVLRQQSRNPLLDLRKPTSEKENATKYYVGLEER